MNDTNTRSAPRACSAPAICVTHRTAALALALLAAATSGGAHAALALVAEVRPGSGSGVQRMIGVSETRAYFVGDSTGSSGQPWVSDGTAAGTALTAPVWSAGTPVDETTWTALGNVIVFAADDGSLGEEAWRSDGTGAGTVRLLDAVAGAGDGFSRFLPRLGSQALFLAFEGGSAGVYSTQGTGVTRLFAKAGGSSGAALLDGSVFFGESTGITRTSGQVGDATMAVDTVASVEDVMSVNDRLFFRQSISGDEELWTSDGTTANTSRVKDIFPGASSQVRSLTRVDDRVFFTAVTPNEGRELWSSDGTEAGTVLVKDIRLGTGSSDPDRLVALGGKLYFAANDGVNGRELWSSDGTAAGTVLVKDFATAIDGFSTTQQTISAIGGRLYIVAGGGGAGGSPFGSDGTTAGTVPLTGDDGVRAIGPFVGTGGRVFVQAYDFTPTNNGNELFGLNALADFGPSWCDSPSEVIRDNAAATSRITLPPSVTIGDLDVRLDLFHRFASDLTIRLKHVDTNTEIQLLTRPRIAPLGSFCTGDIVDLVFDDEAASSADTTCANARLAYPRDTSRRPTNALSAFDGDNLGGTWELTVSDSVGGDRGIVHEWCLAATAAAPLADPIFANGFE